MAWRWTMFLTAMTVALVGCAKKPEPVGDITRPPAPGEYRPYRPSEVREEYDRTRGQQIPAPPPFKKHGD